MDTNEIRSCFELIITKEPHTIEKIYHEPCVVLGDWEYNFAVDSLLAMAED